MTEEQRKKHEKMQTKGSFAGTAKPSMLRRSDYHDYSSRHMYMITMTTNGRQPLFGTLQGHPDAPEGSADYPHVALSPLGQAVAREWAGISGYYPQIKVVATCVMPDHLHGILFVQEQLPVHLGRVIAGFKQGCNKIWREMSESRHEMATHKDESRHEMATHKDLVLVGRDLIAAEEAGVEKGTEAGEAGVAPVFSQGYNDRILLEKDQLEVWMKYLRENPFRLAMKRAHPDLFRVDTALPLFGRTFSAMGNRFLLQRPGRLQVQCSRSLNKEQIEERVAAFLPKVKSGAVLVSPSYSEGERAVMRAAFEAGGSLIVLMEKGFHQLEKPPRHFFDACAEGRMLWLSPYAYSNREVKLTRAICLELNEYARRICEEG